MQTISKNQVKYIRSLQQKKVRDAEGVFVAEGRKCIEELAPSFPCKLLVLPAEDAACFSTVTRQQSDSRATAERHWTDNLSWVGRGSVVGRDFPAPTFLFASQTEIEQMSSLRTPQGAIAVFQRCSSGVVAEYSPISNHQSPIINNQSPISPSLDMERDLILALDGVQDPGNLGTIIRTADWFGVRHIVCSRDTADCWNPKVVQATMGALARVQVHYTNLVEFLGEARGCAASRAASPTFQQHTNKPTNQQPALPIYGTLLDGVNIYEKNAIPQKQNGIIVMGNEGNGISPEVRALITHPLFIPSYPADNPTVESLNVSIATAIILAEFRR